jgi:hypothetical protein
MSSLSLRLTNRIAFGGNEVVMVGFPLFLDSRHTNFTSRFDI